MGEKVEEKRVFNLSDAATSLLKWIILLEVMVPHLKAICVTLRDKPWLAAGPIDVTSASDEQARVARVTKGF